MKELGRERLLGEGGQYQVAIADIALAEFVVRLTLEVRNVVLGSAPVEDVDWWAGQSAGG